MNLSEAKEKITAIEHMLDQHPFVVAHTFNRNGRKLHLALTERLYRSAKKGRVWKSKAFLTALKNAEYGFDEKQARSLGGVDGIFLLDRTFTPKNEMMRKVFDQYMDKVGSGMEEVAEELAAKTSDFRGVRLVSHQMRLLGILWRNTDEDWLVLIDYD